MMKAQKAILSLFQSKELIDKDKCLEYIEGYTDDLYSGMNVDIKFKHSLYNVVKHKDRTYLIYNTLFNSMITLSDTEYEQYEKINFSELFLIGNLVDNGFLLPVSIDEFERYNYYKDILINKMTLKNHNHYTVAVTSKCNARCFYCYEKGINYKDMSLDTADRLAELIVRSKKEADITWFGGEPLLKTDIISYVSEYLRNHNKEFNSTIITNGSLLSEDMIKNKFSEWNVNGVQITLDGMKEEYLKRKCYCCGKDDVFDNVIKNIGLLAENEINVSVRLNIDKNNYEDCYKAAVFLKEIFRDIPYINVYPAFLYQHQNSLSSEYDRLACSSMIYKLYNPEFSIMSWYPKVNQCFINQQGAFVIDTDGGILACDGDVGKQKTKFSDVFSADNFDNLEKPDTVIPEVREMCRTCKFYPKCGGGCASSYGSSCEYDACFMARYETEYLIDQLINS